MPLKTETEMTDVGASQTSSKPAVAPVFQKAKAAARPKKTAAQPKIENDDGDLEVLQQSPVRKPRAASKKVPIYNLSDSESNGDDMLFDVGKMVKGIDNASADQNAGSRPLFSSGMPRPGSSSGLAKKTGPAAKQVLDLDDDDTDYSKLAPPPVSKRGASVTARSKVLPDVETDEDENGIFPARARSPPTKASKNSKASKAAPAPPTKSQAYDTDEEDDDSLPARVPSPPPKASKASKTAKQTAAKPKASSTAIVKKTTQTKLTELPKVMSPAAKAYAAKRARNAAKNDVDAFNAVEKVAEEIMDEGSIIAGEDDPEEDDESLVVRRPARKAAVQAAVKSKKSYKLDSDEDDEDEIGDDEDEEDEESEGFDEDDD